jgi:glutathione S-transferase
MTTSPRIITVWGRASSVNVMKVLWLLDELAIPFDRIEAGGAFGRTRDADYAAMNPNATVPTLVMPHGYTLWESHAILRYLCRTQPGGNAFYPEAPEARADVERWMDWTLASLNEPMRVIFWTFVRTPEAERDLVAAAKACDNAERLWRIVEAQLEGRDYVAGAFSIADMAMGGFLHRWFALPVARPELPRLRGWYERLQARTPYRTHVAVPLT